jgi:carboxyl-terminal processing protease
MRGTSVIVVTATFCISLLPAENAAGQSESASGSPTAVFNEVWETVSEHFYDPDFNGVDWDSSQQRFESRAAEAVDAEALAVVINAMLSELRTSHTHFYTRYDPEYYQLLDLFSAGPLGEGVEKLFPDGEARYEGIGVFTREIEGKKFVSGVLEGCPASVSGLQVGDQILSADGEPFHRIRSFMGKAGKSVHLQVQSVADPAQVREVVVVPVQIHPNQAFHDAMKKSIRVIETGRLKTGYVHVWSYAGESYHELLVEEIALGKLKDVDALVLDLRDGWGGANPNYLNLFNKNVPVMMQIDRSGEKFQYDTQWRKPVALLINGGSRSGKEVLAYGFKKYGLGKIVGTRTAGYVTGGRPFLMSDGSVLFLAVADVWVDGERLEGKGVHPDIEVAFPIPYAQGNDPQMEKAVQILSEQISHIRQ